MVEEQIWDDPGNWGEFPMTMEPDGSSGFPWLILWIGIGVLVVGGVVTLIVLLNVKKKKKKKLTEADIDWEDDLDDVLNDSKFPQSLIVKLRLCAVAINLDKGKIAHALKHNFL